MLRNLKDFNIKIDKRYGYKVFEGEGIYFIP